MLALVSVCCAQTVQICVENTGNSNVQNAGCNNYDPGRKISLESTPSNNYAFEKWTVDAGGNCTIEDPYSRTTKATAVAGGACRIRPSVVERRDAIEIEKYDSSKDASILTNGTTTKGTYGVRFSYSGFYWDTVAVILSDYDGSSKIYYNAEGYDQTLYSDMVIKDGRIYVTPDLQQRDRFNQNNFYAFVPEDAITSEDGSFSITMKRTIALKVTSDGDGSAYIGETGSESYTKYAVDDDQFVIRAVPDAGHYFAGWVKTSGDCPIEDANQATTTLTVSGKVYRTCSYEATFKAGKIHELSATPTTLNFKKDGLLANGKYELRAVFTAEKAGTYVLRTSSTKGSSYIDSGDDPTFKGTQKSLAAKGSITWKMEAGDTHYLLFSQTETDDPSDIEIVVKRKNTLSYDLNGKGVYSTRLTDPDSLYPINASAITGKQFDKWEYDEKCVVTDVTEPSTSVKVIDDCSVSATYKIASVLPITETAKKYSFSSDGYMSGTYYNMNMAFVPTDSGTYRLSYKPYNSYTFYLYNLGSDDSFDASSAYGYAVGTSFERTQYLGEVNGDGRYFVFASSYSSQYLTVKAVRTYHIQLEFDEHSTGHFDNGYAHDTTHVNGETIKITASATDGKRLSYVKVTNGKCTINDSTSQFAQITVNGDCTVKVFTEDGGDIYPISTTPTVYNYDQHRSEVNGVYGIRTVFEPEEDGLYSVVAKGRSSEVGLLSYDKDFKTYKPVGTTPFNGTAGSQYYFLVTGPYITPYTSAKNDTITISVMRTVVLSSSVSGSGTVSLGGVSGLSADSSHIAGDSVIAYAKASTGSRFDHWEKVSGSCTIRNENEVYTYISLMGDCEVKAYFEEGDIYEITEDTKTFFYSKNGSLINNQIGIKTFFEVTEPGTYKYIYSGSCSTSRFSYNDEDFVSYSSINPVVMRYTATGKYYNFFKASGCYYYNYDSTDSINVKVQRTYKVSVDTSGSGYVYLNGYSSLVDSTAAAGDTLSLSASVRYSSRFLKWEVVSGSCAIVDTSIRTTNLIVNGDCNIKAYFGDGIIYDVTDVPTTYSFQKHYYTENSSSVYFSFEAPDDGRYGIVLKNKGSSSYQYYYKCSDSTCSSYSRSYIYSVVVDSVEVSKGDKVWFYVAPYSTYYLDDEFTVNYVDLESGRVIISLLSDSLGSVTPAGYPDAVASIPYSIRASASRSGYRFDHWNVKSGIVSIDNKDTSYTYVTASTDATIEASFRMGDIHEIDETEKTFAYTKDYYSDYGYSRKYEVALKWTATDTGYFFLDIEDVGGDIYVYTYGTDSTFYSYKNSLNFYNGHKFYFNVSTVGTTYYWTVAPYSSSYYQHSFSAKIGHAYALTVTAAKNGYVSNSSYALEIGEDTTVSAYGAIGYLFSKWNVVSGTPSIEDPASKDTKVSITENSAIEATFRKGPVQNIGTTEKTFTFNEDKFTDNRSYNNYVAMSWTAPDSGWYLLKLSCNTSANFRDYGTDSTFGRVINSGTFYSAGDQFAFRGVPGAKLYWIAGPVYSSDSTKSFTVQIAKAGTLTILADSEKGSVRPSASIPLEDGKDTTVYAYSKIGYVFDGWSEVSGKVTISNEDFYYTKVSTEGDATIEAGFRKGPVQKIDTTEKTFTFNKDFFTDNSSHVQDVAMTWTAPDSGWYNLEITSPDDQLSIGYLWTYTDSTFGSSSRTYYNLPAKKLFQGKNGVAQYWSFQRYYVSDSSLQFTVKISKAPYLTVASDGHGSVTPLSPQPISSSTRFWITAVSNFGYKFKEWTTVSGNPSFTDSTAMDTYVSPTEETEVKATFTKGSVHPIDSSSKRFVFEQDYYTDTTDLKNSVFMSWSTPDTNWYMMEVIADSSIDMILSDFGKDLSPKASKGKKDNKKLIYPIQGTNGDTSYYALQPVFSSDAKVGFSIRVVVPYVLYVENEGHGAVFPEGGVVLPQGGDTTVLSIPYGGYVFNKWVVTKGNVTIADSTSAKTTVTVNDSTCSIKATYTVDFTTVPSLTINSVTTGEHPKICSIVSVVDSNSNRSIFDLDSTNFVLFEDGKPLPATVTSPKNVHGVSVVFVVDESGSIGSIQQAAREYVTRFVNEMEVYDQVAIVGYVDTVRVVQSFTSNKTDLLDAITRLRFTGAYEDIALGAYSGVELGAENGGAKAIIVFSDGCSDHKKFPASNVVKLANRYSTSIYTIAFKKSSGYSTSAYNYGFDILQDMAAGTGGRYYETAGITETQEILAQIRNDMQTRYTVCYTTPDTILDGDTHHIEIGVTYRGKESSDTASWQEPFAPPKVRLTKETAALVGDTLGSDTLAISVVVSSKTSMKNVYAYVRKAGSTSTYSGYIMTHVRDSLWSMTVSPYWLTVPGIDFYVSATDSLYDVGSAPDVAKPGENPYTIYIRNESSSIQLVTNGCVDTTKAEISLDFEISDKEGLNSVSFYHRHDGTASFDTLLMSHKTSDVWSVMIPATAFGGKDLEYYVEAVDKYDAVTRWGLTDNHTLQGCEVIEPDPILPPKVRLTTETMLLVSDTLESDTLTVAAVVTSDTSLMSVYTYARVNGSKQTYTRYVMTRVRDSLWSVSMPADWFSTPGIDFYVIAMDSLGNIGFAPDVAKPDENPYTVYIRNEPTSIQLVTKGCVDTTKAEFSLDLEISDKEGLDSAYFYYRNSDKVSFDTLLLKRKDSGSDIWNVTSPTAVFGGKNLEYNVAAVDKFGMVVLLNSTKNRTLRGCEVPAAPDEKDFIKIVNGDDVEKPIARTTEKIKLTLESQDFTAAKDTLTVSLTCLVSGDIESNLKVAEKKAGYYEITKNVGKNEFAPKRGDGKISCRSSDTLVAEFKDPVYNTIARDSVVIRDSVKIAYQFLDKRGNGDLDSVETSDGAAFTIRVTALSKSLYDRDTVTVLLFTNKGDTLKVKAVETDVYSSEFEYTSAFKFVGEKKQLKDDQLDAVFDFGTSHNRIKIMAGLKNDDSPLKSRDSLIVYSYYVAADYAEIYDRDLDGRADSVRIHFADALEDRIESIDSIFWNAGGKDWRKGSKSMMRVSEDSMWVETIIKDPFEYGLTYSGKDPYIRMQKSLSDRTQKVTLRDKIGPVPVKASKHPGVISTSDYLDAITDIPPDTLYVTMSEGISTKEKKTPWKDLFRYSNSCSDTATHALRLLQEPEVSDSGKVWKLVLQDRRLVVDNCIRTNPKVKYTDSQKNAIGRGGVKVGGKDSDIYLYEVSSNTRLSKGGKTPKWIPPGKSEWEKVPDSLQTVRVGSIAPYNVSVVIYDNYSNVVTSFRQVFTKKEMEMESRANDQDPSKLGFLYWNERSSEGRKVGSGVYIWRIDFGFEDGHKEYRILKTGVKRRE